jgi:hypothetical protein
VKKLGFLAFALALGFVAWPNTPAGAASRCYPTERFKMVEEYWVRDTLTRLLWQRRSSPTTLTWAEAQTYCSNAGFRLPTVKELLSLLDLAVVPPGRPIDQTAFPNTPAEDFWTSSPSAGTAGLVWIVSFGNGGMVTAEVGFHSMVRCVR